MVVTGGGFAAFQRHLGRIMGYGAIAETGFSMLALSLDFKIGIPILFLLIPLILVILLLVFLLKRQTDNEGENVNFLFDQ